MIQSIYATFLRTYNQYCGKVIYIDNSKNNKANKNRLKVGYGFYNQ